MLLIYLHSPTRTDEGVTRMTSERDYDEDVPDGPYVHHRLVDPRWEDRETPSQCDRAAIVLGQLSNPHVAADPHGWGERREGPTTSWWRTKLIIPASPAGPAGA
jgi:hypothetical protein